MATMFETAVRSTVTKGIYLLADFNRMRLGWNKTPHPYLIGIHRPMTWPRMSGSRWPSRRWGLAPPVDTNVPTTRPERVG
jgi:hypothetical protein